MILNSIIYGASSSIGGVRTATTLPSSVLNGQIFVMTATTPPQTHISYSQPADPSEGDLWIRTVSNGQGYSFKSGVIRIYPGAVRQYVGSTWVLREAYIGVSDVWTLFSTASPLSELSWSQLSSLSKSGEDMGQFFNLKDSKEILIGSDTYEVEVIGFSHDDLAEEEGKAGFTFQTKNVLDTEYALSTDSVDNWGDCTFGNTLNTLIYGQLPAELRNVIRTAAKGCNNARSRYAKDAVVEYCRLFLLSGNEIMGNLQNLNYYQGEGNPYPVYRDADSQIKYSRSGDASNWWTRTGYQGGMACITVLGGYGATGSAGEGGIAFAFCI